MEYIIAAYIGLILSNTFLNLILKKDEQLLDIRFSFSDIFIPFTIIYNLKSNYKLKAFLSNILGIVTAIVFVSGVQQKVFENSIFISDYLVFIMFQFTLLSAFVYISIRDLYYYFVPQVIVEYLFFIAIFANIVVGSSRVILELLNIESTLFHFTTLGSIENLLGLALGLVLTLLLIKISNEKYLGMADVYIVGIIGAILGIYSGGIALLITLILGSICGILYVAINRKYKEAIIPMVPFLTLGYVFAFSYTDFIIEFLFKS